LSRAGTPRQAESLVLHLALSAVLLVAVAFVALIATPREAAAQEQVRGIGIRLVDVPVTAKDDPRARIYIVDHLAPGAHIQRRVEVSNSTTASHHVSLYSGSATIQNGTFIGDADRTTNELSQWTSVRPGEVALAPGEKMTATVAISVPEDAAPGEQYGVVWAEARSGAAAGGGIAQVSRVGIRLYVSVGPGGAPAQNFTVESLTAARSAKGEPLITATVHNTGGRALDLTGTLVLSDGPGGLNAGPFPAELGRTLGIGDTQTVVIALDDRLPAGPWHAEVMLRSGMTERRGEATITFPASGTAAASPTAKSAPGRQWPVPAAAGVTFVLALVGLWFFRRVRHRAGQGPQAVPFRA
jgi:hypothetical protein